MAIANSSGLLRIRVVCFRLEFDGHGKDRITRVEQKLVFQKNQFGSAAQNQRIIFLVDKGVSTKQLITRKHNF